MDDAPCCSPATGRRPAAGDGGRDEVPDTADPGARAPDAGSTEGMVRLEGGRFLMGSEGPETWPADGEGPVREVELTPFWIDRTCVTNDRFAAFAEATGYVTEAERFGWSFVFLEQMPAAHRRRAQLVTVQGTPWWVRVEKADWRKPGGPGTNVRKRGDHPVVHVSWRDAAAYARWAGKRLPTEAEWEFAARGGLEQAIYPWGDELTPGGKHRCNIWQGRFPEEDTGDDGYTGTAPAKSFPANGFGLYHCVGNVWEWTADWFGPPERAAGEPLRDPTGPATGESRVIKGGSFLCHHSYCNRYRNAARSGNTPDSSTCHTGFRCVATR